MNTSLKQARSVAAQQVARFTGEGAYHGSARPRPAPAPAASPEVDEMRPLSLAKYDARDDRSIDTFAARFPSRFETLTTLPVPTQDEITADRVRPEGARGVRGVRGLRAWLCADRVSPVRRRATGALLV